MTVEEQATSAPVVSLRFAPRPEHVRAARLVAVSVARRVAPSEADLDEVRLAVGETCARAVRRSLALAEPATVLLELVDDDGLLAVSVTDGAGQVDLEDEDVGLALVGGLADSVEVSPGPGGPDGCVRIVWDWR